MTEEQTTIDEEHPESSAILRIRISTTPPRMHSYVLPDEGLIFYWAGPGECLQTIKDQDFDEEGNGTAELFIFPEPRKFFPKDKANFLDAVEKVCIYEFKMPKFDISKEPESNYEAND